MKRHAIKADPRYLLVNLYQTITKVWLRKMFFFVIQVNLMIRVKKRYLYSNTSNRKHLSWIVYLPMYYVTSPISSRTNCLWINSSNLIKVTIIQNNYYNMTKRFYHDCKACVDFCVLWALVFLHRYQGYVHKTVLLCYPVHFWGSSLGPQRLLDPLGQLFLGMANHFKATRLFVETKWLWEGLNKYKKTTLRQ